MGSYIVIYRTREGRQRTYTIGKHGSPWSPDTARQEARRVLGEVVKGADPLAEKTAGRKAITVADLCRQYLGDVESGRLLTRRKVAKKEFNVGIRPGADRASHHPIDRAEVCNGDYPERYRSVHARRGGW